MSNEPNATETAVDLDNAATDYHETKFAPKIDVQAWSNEEPDTDPDTKPEHHEWSVVWRYAAALSSSGIAVAVVVGAALYATGLGHDGRPVPPPITNSPVVTTPTPPPPRVDTVADFESAFKCTNGDYAWSIGGADFYGGPAQGTTITQANPSTLDNVGRWQPQLLLNRFTKSTTGVVSDCTIASERLKPLGVTAVTAPLREATNSSSRIRYFTTQTPEQSITLQTYLRGTEKNWSDPMLNASVDNTGFCVESDTRPCEVRY